MPDFTELELLNSPLDPGLTVIEASAGTGKTYSISHLVPRLLLEGTLEELPKLLLVTFTKDAARELADRVRRVLTQLSSPAQPDEASSAPHIHGLRALLEAPKSLERLKKAMRDLDQLSVSTIHAFCQRTLQQEGSLCGLPVMPELETEDSEWLERLAREQWINRIANNPELAAISTVFGWTLGQATTVVEARRRHPAATLVPPAGELAALAAQRERLIRTLKDPVESARLLAIATTIPQWKGGHSPAEILSRIDIVVTQPPTSTEFWECVAWLGTGDTELSELVYARSKADKALKASIQGLAWVQAMRSLPRLVQQTEWAWQNALASTVLPALEKRLHELQLITQDGLIERLHAALHRTGPAGQELSDRLASQLASRYSVALIDESQDTDPRQYAIFKRIFLDSTPLRHLILVGDPKQAIYAFRGADLATYLHARETALRGYTLTKTHRAPEPLVDAVNRLFGRPRSFHHKDMKFTPASSALKAVRSLEVDGSPCPPLDVWLATEDDKRFSVKARLTSTLSQLMADTIVSLLLKGRLVTRGADGLVTKRDEIRPSDFAVLVANHRQARAMAEALQACNVPVVINSGADVFTSEEASELLVVLTAIQSPSDIRLLHTALATRMLGLDAVALSELEEISPGGLARSSLWTEQFVAWQKTWNDRGPAALFAALDSPNAQIHDTGISARLALIPLIGERRVTNYRQLTDLLLDASREMAPRPADLIHWLAQQISRASERTNAEDRQLQLSSDREAVQVVTMHASKGLQYPLVFCPYLAEPLKNPGKLEYVSKDYLGDLQVPSGCLAKLGLVEDSDLKALLETAYMRAQLEERLRLAYVALTRAQVHAWTFSYSGAPRFDQASPLDWLLRTDAEVEQQTPYDADWVKSCKLGRAQRHRTVLDGLAKNAKSMPGTGVPSNFPASLSFIEAPERSGLVHARKASGDSLASEQLQALPTTVTAHYWRITSFSAITAEKHEHGMPSANNEAKAPATEMSEDLPLFFRAPGGTSVGTAVHDWIENWDFTEPDPELLREQFKHNTLPELREDPKDWSLVFADLFRRLRHQRLPGLEELRLAELCEDPSGSEWRFHLPLGNQFCAARIADCFETHAPEAQRPYADALRTLSDGQFKGYLEGFIDRLFRNGDGLGLIDWKTNKLGDTLDDYNEASLLRCAMESHYLLQMHLYLVALRRYQHALGLTDAPPPCAWLVFVRAVQVDGTRGVLRVNPSEEFLAALDPLFATPSVVNS